MENEYAAWQNNPTAENLNALLDAAKPTLRSAATSYAAGQQDQVMTQAKILAIKAFKNFDPKKGTKLRTHLMTQLQPLYRVAHERRSAVAVPERAAYNLHTMNETETALRDELGRDPSDEEVADRTGLSVGRILNLRKNYSPEVFEGSLFDDQGSPVMTGVSRPKNEDIWSDFVYHDLGPIDKQIFAWRTGYRGKPILPVQEIAKRLQLTSSAVTQRAARLQKRMTEMPIE